MMKWDIIDIALPWRYFVVESLHAGQFPFWNPFNHLGFPQMGDPSSWYPITWLLSLFGRYTVSHIQFEYLLHLVLAAFGAYKLFLFELTNSPSTTKTKRWISLTLAICYACSGFMVSNAQHLGWVISAAWIPYCIYFFRAFLVTGKWYYAFALPTVLFMLLTGGYPGFFITCMYVLLGIFIVHLFRIRKQLAEIKSLWKLTVPAVLFILQAAVVLYCSFEMSKYINRGEDLVLDTSKWGVLFGAFPWEASISFLFPMATTTPGTVWPSDVSMLNAYFGIVSATLALGSLYLTKNNLRGILYFILGLVFLLSSYGDGFIVRALWYHILPFMDLFRFPALFRLFSLLFLLMAGVLTLDKVWNMKLPIKQVNTMFLTTGLALLFGLFYYTAVPKEAIAETPDVGSFFNTWSFNKRIVIQAISGLLFLVLSWLLIQKRQLVALALLVGLELFIYTQLNVYSTVVDAENDFKKTELALTRAPIGFPLESLYDTVRLKTDEGNKNYPYLWKNLSAFQKEISADGVSPYGLKSMAVSIERDEFTKAINHPSIYFEPEADSPNQAYQLKILSYSGNELTFEINTESNGKIVFLQNTYPNWKVEVDGEEHEIQIEASTFLATSIEVGKSKVRFYFDSNKEQKLFWVTAVSFLISIGAFLLLFFKENMLSKK
ncbi:MAG: hypothetical protein KDC83_00440 [Flavobacteriales bacterium]|nr:hypothetical protein [Flavobacteriales bacterium]